MQKVFFEYVGLLYHPPIIGNQIGNQIEKKMENEMETAVIQVRITLGCEVAA